MGIRSAVRRRLRRALEGAITRDAEEAMEFIIASELRRGGGGEGREGSFEDSLGGLVAMKIKNGFSFILAWINKEPQPLQMITKNTINSL